MAAKKQVVAKTDDEFWEFVKETSDEVATWPEWMREGGRSEFKEQSERVTYCADESSRTRRMEKHAK